MTRKTLFARCLCLVLATSSAVLSQVSLPGGPLPAPLPSQTNFIMGPAGGPVNMVINTPGVPPGTTVIGLLSLDDTPSVVNGIQLSVTPDVVTNLTFQHGLNSCLGNICWHLQDTVSPQGTATLSLSGPLPVGVPFFVSPVVVQSFTVTPMAGQAEVRAGPARTSVPPTHPSAR